MTDIPIKLDLPTPHQWTFHDYRVTRDDLIVVIPLMRGTKKPVIKHKSVSLESILASDEYVDSDPYIRAAFYARESILRNTTAKAEGVAVKYYVEDVLRDVFLSRDYVQEEDCLFWHADVEIPRRISFKCLAPIRDSLLKDYENVIITDADFFIARNGEASQLPIDDLSGKGQHKAAKIDGGGLWCLSEDQYREVSERIGISIDTLKENHGRPSIYLYSYPSKAMQTTNFKEFITSALQDFEIDDESALRLWELKHGQFLYLNEHVGVCGSTLGSVHFRNTVYCLHFYGKRSQFVEDSAPLEKCYADLNIPY